MFFNREKTAVTNTPPKKKKEQRSQPMMRIGIMASKQTSEEETGGENTETWHRVNHFLDFSLYH